MWRMQDGDRVLTDPEWDVFAAGLDPLRSDIESDIEAGTDDADTGVAAFDRLTAEQKLNLLADVAQALRDRAVPTPRHTAANEGAVAAVLATFRDMLGAEVEDGGPVRTDLRAALLAAFADPGDHDPPLPRPDHDDWDEWVWLCEEVEDRVLWDRDFELGDEVLDLPPEAAAATMRAMQIDPEYYLDSPPDPDEAGLTAARQTLARLLGLPVPDDDGLYAALADRYHDLVVGPVSPDEAAAFADHPWVEPIGLADPGWDCGYAAWRAEFVGAIPFEPFRVEQPAADDARELPGGVRVERSEGGWVVRDEGGSYWCDLVGNGWTDGPDDDTPLTFPSRADAEAAYAQADRMYAERSERRAAALVTLGISDRR